MRPSFEADGFEVIESVLAPDEITELIAYAELTLPPAGKRGGMRNLLGDERMRALVKSPTLQALVAPILGAQCFSVRGILFDKTPEANWKVPWHQDVTIAVHGRQDAEGYSPWSIKETVVHVQPPAEVLERMLTVRLHLDDCPAKNGALKVIAGSHLQGKLPESQVAALAIGSPSEVCEVRAGGALLMRPLLIHASSAATAATHRRVLHFDFAYGELAPGSNGRNVSRWAAHDENSGTYSGKSASDW